MKLSLGFSTCPNDTFIFDALVHHKVDTEGLEFDVTMADIEVLNHKAVNSSIDITKISFHAYAYAAQDYLLLNAGSALGKGNGPLLIARKLFTDNEIKNLKIAIPGKLTTGNMLLTIFYPEARNKEVLLFSEIEDAILQDQVEAGVIIHESRFTYKEKGLLKIADLGEKWDDLTGIPIPLGGIAIRRGLDLNLIQKTDRILKRSVEFALANPQSSIDFVRNNAMELNDRVIKQHINLYVNDYTVNLGNSGRMAVERILDMAMKAGIINELPEQIFV